MMISRIFFQQAPSDYPNRLSDSISRSRGSAALRCPAMLLAALVLLALVPRAMMVLRVPTINPDGVLYIQQAKALEAGNLRAGLHEMAVNVYPIILMGLHRLGLEWEAAAALWGVTVSSLVVLPLWGWVRRQFDDRVALVACLLYIVHAKFIAWSPEVMRDQTFWLLFVLAIYWMWRAVTEVRYRYFMGAGVAILLASATRLEGLFLLIPLTLWTFWRWLALSEKGSGVFDARPRDRSRRALFPFPASARGKLFFGAVLCVAIFPAALALVNVAWFCGHADWVGVRISPLARVQPWLEWLLGHGPAASDAADPPLRIGRMIWVFIPTMTRGLGQVFALLMFGGIWGWRRIWARRDNQALFYTAVVVMCGIWVQLWYDKYICPRYALSIVLMASPFAALGMLGLLGRVGRIAARLGGSARCQTALQAGAAAVVAVIGLGDAMTGSATYFEMRQMSADVGHWVRREFPTPPLLVGPVGIAPIANYYAQGNPCLAFRWEADDAAILAMVQDSRAGVVLLRPTKQLSPERCEALIDRLRPLGFAPVDPARLPRSHGDMQVLVRRRENQHVTERPRPQSKSRLPSGPPS